jgi:hypothetical protein
LTSDRLGPSNDTASWAASTIVSVGRVNGLSAAIAKAGDVVLERYAIGLSDGSANLLDHGRSL